jgi:hypothetical protein
MSYYPILSAPYCTGKTTLYNFPPNSWESADKCDQVVSLTCIKDGLWHSKIIGKLKYQEYKVVDYSDIVDLTPDGAGSVVTKSIDKNVIAAGVPAVIIKKRRTIEHKS